MAANHGDPIMRDNGRMDYFPGWDGIEILNVFSQLRLTLEARGVLAYEEYDSLYCTLNLAEAAVADRIDAREGR